MKTTVLNLQNIDQTVKPGEDFFHYAVGNWLKTNPIPDEYSSWGSFTILAEENLHRLQEIMEKAADQKGPIERLVSTYYATGMDEKKIDQEGVKPLQAEFNKIAAIKNYDELVIALARIHRLLANPLFNFSVGADPADSDYNIAQLDQGGLNLPDRDYYLKDDPETKRIREKYLGHVENIFSLMGEGKELAVKDAATILKIETALAKVSWDKVALRDPRKNHNPMNLKKLVETAPDFNWPLYFVSMGLKNPGAFNVGQPDFFSGLSPLLKTLTLDEWKTYLKFCVVNGNADYLSTPFVTENFNFYGRIMNGAKQLMPRWKRVVGNVSGGLDQAVGRLYVKEYFPPTAKRQAVIMVENIRQAFAQRIKKLDWMEAKTKRQALRKLAAMTLKIGYPDKWKDYSKLTLSRDSYLQNAIRIAEFESNRAIKKVGRRVDRKEWVMSPQTVNACYDPTKNEMTFPAGILQPPFFNAAADKAVNYGGIGAIIGHEMTHGFDDQGGKYDAKGDLKDWWTIGDAARFKKKAQGLVTQYHSYEPFPGLPLNGELTLGENIADLGGLNIAYDALEKTLNPKKVVLIDGLTPEQRFFLSFATVWAINVRPERAKMLIKVDPHSPPKYRVNGSLTNLPEFYAAFNLEPKNKRVKIW